MNVKICLYIPIIASYHETVMRCVESLIRIMIIMCRMRLIVMSENHETHPTLLCVLNVLLLLFMNLDVRLRLIVDGNTVYVTSLQFSCKCVIESCNCL